MAASKQRQPDTCSMFTPVDASAVDFVLEELNLTEGQAVGPPLRQLLKTYGLEIVAKGTTQVADQAQIAESGSSRVTSLENELKEAREQIKKKEVDLNNWKERCEHALSENSRLQSEMGEGDGEGVGGQLEELQNKCEMLTGERDSLLEDLAELDMVNDLEKELAKMVAADKRFWQKKFREEWVAKRKVEEELKKEREEMEGKVKEKLARHIWSLEEGTKKRTAEICGLKNMLERKEREQLKMEMFLRRIVAGTGLEEVSAESLLGIKWEEGLSGVADKVLELLLNKKEQDNRPPQMERAKRAVEPITDIVENGREEGVLPPRVNTLPATPPSSPAAVADQQENPQQNNRVMETGPSCAAATNKLEANTPPILKANVRGTEMLSGVASQSPPTEPGAYSKPNASTFSLRSFVAGGKRKAIPGRGSLPTKRSASNSLCVSFQQI